MLYNYTQFCIITYSMHNYAVFTIGFVLAMPSYADL